VQGSLLVARAVLRGKLRGRRLDDLAGDRFEDENSEQRGERRVLRRLQQPRHDDLVAEGEDVRDGRRDQKEQRAGMLART
jgi:hypothetical protein